jgi:hypothetical protein
MSETNPEDEIFDINNTIKFFERQKIQTTGLFVLEKSVIGIMIRYIETAIELFIYVPSKYEIRVNKRDFLSIPVYNIEEDDDEETSNTTLFQNQIATEITKHKKINTTKALQRFLPLIQTSKIKFSYLDKNFLIIMKKNNDIISFLSTNQIVNTGFFYTLDLEMFYTLSKDIANEIKRTEEGLNSSVYIKLEQLIEGNKQYLTKLNDELNTTSPEKMRKKFDSRMLALGKLSSQNEEKKEAALSIMNEVRKDNFKQMFKLEYLANVLNDLKYLEQSDK